MKGDLRRRLSESIEAAAALAGGVVEIDVARGGQHRRGEGARAGRQRGRRQGSEGGGGAAARVSPTASPSASASPASTAAPRSRSSSRGSSPSTRRTAPASAATGSASSGWSIPSWSCPTRRCRCRRARCSPGGVGHSRYWKRLVEAVAEDYGVDPDAPWQELSDEDREIFLYGTGGERHKVTYTQPLRPPALLQRPLRGDRQQPRAPLRGDRLRRGPRAGRGLHGRAALPGLQGRQAAAGEPRGQGRRDLDPRLHASSRRGRR